MSRNNKLGKSHKNSHQNGTQFELRSLGKEVKRSEDASCGEVVNRTLWEGQIWTNEVSKGPKYVRQRG